MLKTWSVWQLNRDGRDKGPSHRTKAISWYSILPAFEKAFALWDQLSEDNGGEVERFYRTGLENQNPPREI